MAKVGIFLTREENSSKTRKMEKKIISIFHEFGINPQGGSVVEMSFIADMSDETAKRIEEIIKPIAEKEGYNLEIEKE